MLTKPTKHRILIADDEPDVHAVTKLALKGLRYNNHPVEFAVVSTGAEAVADMEAHPHTAIILLDVVMESESAGLDACRAIRERLGNRFVRILLRTGQPGVAPEKKTIDEYDIDGYLPKTELTTHRLYAAVRTALKAFDELVDLERHQQALSYVHETAISLRAFESLEVSLDRILTAAAGISGASLAVLDLQTVDENGQSRQYRLHLATGLEDAAGAAEALVAQVLADPAAPGLKEGGRLAAGYVVPIALHRELGRGMLVLSGSSPDLLQQQALTMLAAHATNALYASISQALMAAREGPLFDSVTI